jgi:mono/diheme cytochrome c family protein
MKIRFARTTAAAVLTILAASLLCSGLARADAEATFKSKCAACHGPDGKGATAVGKAIGVHDFASPDVQKMSDDDLATIIAKGKGKMPAYASSLKDADIKDLVAYIRALAKK